MKKHVKKIVHKTRSAAKKATRSTAVVSKKAASAVQSARAKRKDSKSASVHKGKQASTAKRRTQVVRRRKSTTTHAPKKTTTPRSIPVSHHDDPKPSGIYTTHSTKKPARKNALSRIKHNRRLKKDTASRKRAEYLASLPKNPIKRFFYRLHPLRVLAFWFSKRGLLLSLKLFGVVILLGVITVGGVFAYYRKDIDSIRPEKIAERVQTTVTKYYDRNDILLWEDKGTENYRLAVKDDEISKYVKQATIAIEDKEFYDHKGISVSGILRSAINNSRGGEVQGGSTLTQQLVKQVFLAEEAQKRGLNGIPRKIKEVILAIEVERMYSKDQILNLYLNESPYGGRRNGVESAAQTYFAKSAKELTLAESALLAAIPNQPGLYDPYNINGHKALITRQHKTLRHMVELGYITQKEADDAKKVAILDTVKPIKDQLDGIKAPHFVLTVKQQLERELGKAIVGRGGLSVKTTLDYRIQQKVEESMNAMFSSGTPEYAGFTNGAATVEDVKTGQIIAMLGSRSFDHPGFGQDNAATAYIPPGSTIKPLVFAQLFANQGQGNQNFGSGSILADDKSMDKIYGAPLRNADGGYKGAITIRKGLALSRNVPAIKAMYITGKDPSWQTIRGLGDTSYCTQGQEVQAGLSSAIGSCGVKQVDHVNAFASLARGGIHKDSSYILEVKNSKNETLKSFKDEGKRILDEQAAYIVSDILADDNARAGLYGTNRYGLVVPGVRTATKTGTSDKGGQAKDIWTMSYSSSLAMGVWLGNSDATILRNGNSSIPARIIGDVMSFAHSKVYQADGKWKPGDWITQPAGIQRIGGEVYPSYYNKSMAQTNTKMTFDRVSKKKATDCTPAAARVEISVLSYTDPISKKKRFISNDGYNPNEEDDTHKCSDAKPQVTVSPSSDGKKVTVTYVKGTHPLSSVTVTVNGQQIANLSVASSGTQTVPNTVGVTDDLAISASITDSAFYSGSGSSTWEAPATPSPTPTPTPPPTP